MAKDYSKMTISEMREGLDSGNFTSVELTEYFLKNSKEKNPRD